MILLDQRLKMGCACLLVPGRFATEARVENLLTVSPFLSISIFELEWRGWWAFPTALVCDIVCVMICDGWLECEMLS